MSAPTPGRTIVISTVINIAAIIGASIYVGSASADLRALKTYSDNLKVEVEVLKKTQNDQDVMIAVLHESLKNINDKLDEIKQSLRELK